MTDEQMTYFVKGIRDMILEITPTPPRFDDVYEAFSDNTLDRLQSNATQAIIRAFSEPDWKNEHVVPLKVFRELGKLLLISLIDEGLDRNKDKS